MKKLIAVAIALTLAGSAYAGCGKKIPVTGKLASYNAEKKALVVGKKTITLAASAKITDAKGKKVAIKDLVGKSVDISTDKHTKKAESVTEKKKAA